MVETASNGYCHTMGSFRFPFSFSQPPKPRVTSPVSSSSTSRSVFSATIAVAASAAAAGGIAVAGFATSGNADRKKHQLFDCALNLLFPNYLSPSWASIALSDSPNSATVKDSKTGLSFPSILGDSRQLLGIGLRRKSVFGLKNIDIYAFGVYADESDVKALLTDKYGKHSSAELKENKEFNVDLMESDICMTVKLQIVYGRLSIRSVRTAFEDSVGSRLRKLGGSDEKELLQKFTSQFKDEYKLPRESVIDLSRECGHVLRTSIDGKEVGSIDSKLLCRAILDLYIGEDPFDVLAKEDIKLKLAHILHQ